MSGTNVIGVISGLAVFFLPFLFVRLWRARHPVFAAPFAWGVLVWILASGLGWAVVNAYSDAALSIVSLFTPGLAEGVRLNLAAALIYAVLETSLVLWIALKSSYQEATWEKGVCFGLGYGAAECLVYGAGLFAAWARPGLLPEESRASMASLPLVAAAAPLVERTFSYLTHMYAALAVFYGVRSQNWKWVLGAAGYKFIFYAVSAVGWGMASSDELLHTPKDLWTVQLAVLAFGALGLSGLLHLGYVYHRLGDGPGLNPPPAPKAV